MAGKRIRDPTEEESASRSTPKKLRFGSPAAGTTPRTPSKSALKKTAAAAIQIAQEAALQSGNGGVENRVPAASTPTNRNSKRGPRSFVTPTKTGATNITATPSTTSRNADRSARKKATRNLVERATAGELSDEELGDALADRIYDGSDGDAGEDESDEGGDGAGEDHVLPTTEAGESGDLSTPVKRGRGRPKGAKNKRTPTPPPDLPPYERYFFQNRPSAYKHASNTPNALKLLTHGEYYAAIAAHTDPHTASIDALHALHAAAFPRWALELSHGYTVVLHGYGSKRRLLAGFADYIHQHHPPDRPPITLMVNAHHPAFGLRSLLQMLSRALGMDISALPASPLLALEHVVTYLAASPPQNRVYILLSTMTVRVLTTPAALTVFATLAQNKHTSLLLTASNPSFPLLWPSEIRDALNPVIHDATTFLPYDSGTSSIPAPQAGLSALGASAPDAVSELLGRKSSAAATRERVRWVLQSLPANARGLYRLLLESVLAAVDADAVETADSGLFAGAEGGFDPYDADPDFNLGFFDEGPPKRGRGRPRKDGSLGLKPLARGEAAPLPAVSAKTLYNQAAAAFLCSSEMAFRGLLREFVDHAMVEVQRGDASEGGELLGVGMPKADAEGVLEDLQRDM